MGHTSNVFDDEVIERRCYNYINDVCLTTRMGNSNTIFSSTELRVDKNTLRLLEDRYWTVVWKTKICLILISFFTFNPFVYFMYCL